MLNVISSLVSMLGGFPYATVNNHELLAFLLSGKRLERPENCSEHLYKLMLSCWAELADNRPDFVQIVSKLEPDHQRIYVDFNELRHDYVFPPIVDLTQTRTAAATPETNSTTSSSAATDSTVKR